MKRSAGVLLYRRTGVQLEVLLVLPGGPYWARKDRGAWQMPKGEIGAGETAEEAARREVAEEIGLELTGPLQPLGDIRQAGGKCVIGYAVEHAFDPATLQSAEFEMEWPPRSGQRQCFPEVSAAKWLELEEARASMLPSQLPLLDRLAELAG